MAKKTTVKAIKTGVPKRKDLKDFDQQFNIVGTNVETLKLVFQHAIPQLGRELAKNNHYGNARTQLMSAAGLASDAYAAIDGSKADSHYQLLEAVATEAGYERDRWTVTDKCGNSKVFSWDDLYGNTEVEVVIRVSTKLKDDKTLADAGVK
jgi:hypothetical protein